MNRVNGDSFISDGDVRLTFKDGLTVREGQGRKSVTIDDIVQRVD